MSPVSDSNSADNGQVRSTEDLAAEMGFAVLPADDLTQGVQLKCEACGATRILSQKAAASPAKIKPCLCKAKKAEGSWWGLVKEHSGGAKVDVLCAGCGTVYTRQTKTIFMLPGTKQGKSLTRCCFNCRFKHPLNSLQLLRRSPTRTKPKSKNPVSRANKSTLEYALKKGYEIDIQGVKYRMARVTFRHVYWERKLTSYSPWEACERTTARHWKAEALYARAMKDMGKINV
jgi:hypothetical protein